MLLPFLDFRTRICCGIFSTSSSRWLIIPTSLFAPDRLSKISSAFQSTCGPACQNPRPQKARPSARRPNHRKPCRKGQGQAQRGLKALPAGKVAHRPALPGEVVLHLQIQAGLAPLVARLLHPEKLKLAVAHRQQPPVSRRDNIIKTGRFEYTAQR